MIAPALISVGIPIALPMVIKATPMVATVVHELPIAEAIIAHTTQLANKKNTRVNNLNSIIYHCWYNTTY